MSDPTVDDLTALRAVLGPTERTINWMLEVEGAIQRFGTASAATEASVRGSPLYAERLARMLLDWQSLQASLLTRPTDDVRALAAFLGRSKNPAI